jgi:hypothetical protein
MVATSLHPAIEIPDIDIWEFLFERTDREWPDDKSKPTFIMLPEW